jgi:hypothetical protein
MPGLKKERDHEPDHARRSRRRHRAAAAAAQTFPLECAQRDAKLVTQMEQHGEAQDVPGDILYEGYWTMKRAREACYQGRVVVGLALYDSIFRQSLAGLAQAR